jgi:hypothetical protein
VSSGKVGHETPAPQRYVWAAAAVPPGVADAAMTTMNKEQTAYEIAKLEQELENLERAYAALEQGTWWAKQAFFVFIAALIAIALWCVVNGKVALIVGADGGKNEGGRLGRRVLLLDNHEFVGVQKV